MFIFNTNLHDHTKDHQDLVNLFVSIFLSKIMIFIGGEEVIRIDLPNMFNKSSGRFEATRKLSHFFAIDTIEIMTKT